jgi:GNAT superfamily N-acetyltransferase
MRLLQSNRILFFRRDCVPVTVMTGETDFRLVGGNEFPWETHPLRQHDATYRRRFVTGGRALVGYRDSDIVITAWLANGTLRIDELAFDWHLPDAALAVYDVVTMPAWRGQGIYTAALRHLSSLLADNARELWIYADQRNTASLRGIRRAQFSTAGIITVRRVAGITIRSGRIQGVNA